MNEITIKEAPAGTQVGKWATFFLNSEMFGLRVEDVQEVMMDQPLTPVPLAPEHIVGLLNLRGQIMPAIDLRRRLHFPMRAEGQGSSLIVLRSQGVSLCLVVDEIGDVLELPTASWCEPPDTLATLHRGLVRGICPIDRHVVLGLNVAEIIGDEGRTGSTRENAS
ncbi:MAG: chemotaxis protein CheW [Proteobacteria bacterium]|nr:chemotaxis protein CheW [Pseudomonadota bacterium]